MMHGADLRSAEAPLLQIQSCIHGMVYDINRFMNTHIDSARLRFTTSNFLGLQGLRQVALGIMLLAAIPALALKSPWNLWLFVVLMVLLGISWWRIGIYYERRFGHVEIRKPLWAWPGGGSLLERSLFGAAVILLSVVAVKIFKVNILSPGWGLGVMFAGWTLEKRRWYYQPFAAVFFLLEIVKFAPDEKRLMIEVWLVPFAFIITGIADHLLLIRSLPGASSNDNA
ncbi:MAG: hypothetical protein DMG67_08340 [Acidobacteria bacterium]|nr:MAG: hypothetical protein DMG67_08340 [Acidobacteriota bacterium]